MSIIQTISIIVVILILLGIFLALMYLSKEHYQLDVQTKTRNELIKEENKILQKEKQQLLCDIQENKQIRDSVIEGANQAAEYYFDTLENTYKEKENEYEQQTKILNISYNSIQDQYLENIEKVKQDLEKIKNTRAAAQEAQRQEKIIKENKKDFSLNIDDIYKNDIRLLERIKKDFSNPRIISMLIWQTYFRDIMTELCNYILGSKTICGIYKITNQLTDECYIGQSVDVAKRWKDHAKCGLDIDRPQGNKLYQSMREDDIWNFTFELLEECPRAQLDEKEKFYIELYQSNLYGFNSTKGNSN